MTRRRGSDIGLELIFGADKRLTAVWHCGDDSATGPRGLGVSAQNMRDSLTPGAKRQGIEVSSR